MANLKTAGNVTVVFNSNALTNYLNTSSLDAVVNQIETTDFGDSNATTSIAGLGTWTITLGGPWDSVLDGYIAPDMISPPTTLRTLVYTVGGVIYTWTTNTFFTAYTGAAPSPSDGLQWTGTIQGSGAPVRT